MFAIVILLGFIAAATCLSAWAQRGVARALASVGRGLEANTSLSRQAVEHAAEARASAEKAQASAEVAGTYLRELKDAARAAAAATRRSRGSLPSLTNEGLPRDEEREVKVKAPVLSADDSGQWRSATAPRSRPSQGTIARETPVPIDEAPRAGR